MQDHGADAATVVANASVDGVKSLLKVLATLLKELVLLKIQGSKVTSGETNIDKLIKSLDEGDQVLPIKIPKEQAGKIAELAKKHGVVYAVVENENGETTIYYKASQAERMKNIFEEILGEKVKENTNQEQENQEGPGKTETKKDPEQEVTPDVQEDIPDSQAFAESMGEQTQIFFDAENSQNYVEVRQYGSEGCEIFSHKGDTMERCSAEQMAKEVGTYGTLMTLEAKGFYDAKTLQSQIAGIVKEHQTEKAREEIVKERTQLIKGLYKDSAALDGTLHVLVDNNNANNRIMIYKSLEKRGAEFVTTNKTAIFIDGQKREDLSAEFALAEFGRYRHLEKHGPRAGNQFVQAAQSQRMDWERKKEGLGKDASSSGRKPLTEYQSEVEKIKVDRMKTAATPIQTIGAPTKGER
ncbi:MAG: PcfB family protein [Eubacteriales bacterium]|nr:PcfB family protein [Eubacteriales bacterium]